MVNVDSLLSNIENKHKQAIIDAAKLSGFSDIVYLVDKATYGYNIVLKNFFGVHTLDRTRDHHEFWKKFDEITLPTEKE